MSNKIALPIAELKPALTGLGKVLDKHANLPVLKNIKVERTKEGWIALTATDLDAFATVRLEQPSEGEPTAILVPYEELQKAVKVCTKNEVITVHPTNAGDHNRKRPRLSISSHSKRCERTLVPVGHPSFWAHSSSKAQHQPLR
jgi:DNA polymerase III sliding clamp (beta) subunit (PCNA family)